MNAHCAPCMSRSCKAPCATGRGRLILITFNASMGRGVVHEFVLSHVMVVADPLAPFRFAIKTVEGA